MNESDSRIFHQCGCSKVVQRVPWAHQTEVQFLPPAPYGRVCEWSQAALKAVGVVKHRGSMPCWVANIPVVIMVTSGVLVA